MKVTKYVLLFYLALILSSVWLSANGGENGGVATGEQYQSWRVVLDTSDGLSSVKIDPYNDDNPYFGWPMTNRLIDKIVFDCEVQTGGECSYVGHQPVTGPAVRADDPFKYIPTPNQGLNQKSYLWSD